VTRAFIRLLTRWRTRAADVLARRRVALGFAFGVLVLWLAEPTWRSIWIGGAIAACGEAVRVWAAGHLEKSREVTRSGPYRWIRHPLYLGSTVIATGVAITSLSGVVASIIALYVGTTIPAAMLAEERHLREKFGGAYDSYADHQTAPMPRRFSVSRARRNREHRTVAGVMVGFALLALKVQLSIR
jgi:protein-S-isoprenylcysteine O-methyltransferase Ste14